MRASIVSAALALVVTSVSGCSQRDADACGRAFARIARIDAAHGRRGLPSEFRGEALEACRRGGTASYDPVVRCAMDSPTDEAASACIDRFIHDVVPPPKPGEPRPSRGQGLNPLLDEP